MKVGHYYRLSNALYKGQPISSHFIVKVQAEPRLQTKVAYLKRIIRRGSRVKFAERTDQRYIVIWSRKGVVLRKKSYVPAFLFRTIEPCKEGVAYEL